MGTDEKTFADTLLAELRAWEASEQAITSVHTLLPKTAELAQLEAKVQRLLPVGIGNLYLHQALVLERALLGEHVTLATPTASGKTLALTSLEAMGSSQLLLLRPPSPLPRVIHPHVLIPFQGNHQFIWRKRIESTWTRSVADSLCDTLSSNAILL